MEYRYFFCDKKELTVLTDVNQSTLYLYCKVNLQRDNKGVVKKTDVNQGQPVV